MAKRPADDEQLDALKSGQRPVQDTPDEAGDFEDEFEDEFESEDEIMEAGVDGRPDAEREAEEREGVRCSASSCGHQSLINLCSNGRRSRHIYPRPE